MNKAWRWLAAFSGCVLLWSCAIQNEGLVDYRRTAAPPALDKQGVGPDQAASYKTQVLAPKFLMPNEAKDYIKPSKSLGVFLKYAYIKDFAEYLSKRGEIAIVAKMFEEGGNESFDFTPAGADSGRLVFYSGDVRKGQAGLNFGFLPVYGPTKYNGKPVSLQLYVIELDAEQPALTALLKTLASIGSVAYPPASEILGVLDTLGSALLKGGHDDIVFHYSTTWRTHADGVTQPYPILQAGDFVFLRKEDRKEPFDWSKVTYNATEGSLMWNGNSTRFTGETYLTLQFQSDEGGGDVGASTNTLEQFKKKVSAAHKEKAQDLQGFLTELEAQVKAFKARSQGEAAVARLWSTLGTLGANGTSPERRREAALQYLSTLNAALNCDTSKGCNATLSPADIGMFLGELRKLPGMAGALDGQAKEFNTPEGVKALKADAFGDKAKTISEAVYNAMK